MAAAPGGLWWAAAMLGRMLGGQLHHIRGDRQFVHRPKCSGADEPTDTGSVRHVNRLYTCRHSRSLPMKTFADRRGPTIVIGCGNLLCGDDAAGPTLIRRLRDRGLTASIRCFDAATDAIMRRTASATIG